MPSKLYTALETLIKFADAAQTPDAAMTLSALAAGAGRVSDRFDRGAGSHAALYQWALTCQLTGTNVVGATIEVYFFESDGTRPAGEIGTTNAALATDKRNNGAFAGLLVVDQTTTNTNMTVRGYVFLASRYVTAGVWNATGLPFKTDTAVHFLTLTPCPFEAQ